jgi:predicted dehydrogenase
MGTNQHLLRSLVPIMQQGGVKISDTEVIMPDPVLTGRNPDKLQKIAKQAGVEKWSTDVDSLIADDSYGVYFDAQTTDRRVPWVTKAIEAGKHVYCEKPTAMNVSDAMALYELAEKAGVKHGVVQDKLWLPGLMKFKEVKDSGLLGDILSVRGEFGYWVFEGDRVPAQRPSWNYRKEDGGGIIYDMLCHWRYVMDNLFGEVKAVSCLGATHIKKRWDEQGNEYECTADDAAYASFQLAGDVIAHFNSSWVTRVRRDDLLTMLVDGTEGSAVVGLRKCWVQTYEETPCPVWNPDVENPIDFYDGWTEFEGRQEYQNAFKTEWELFLKHVVCDSPFHWGLVEGAKGVQLAEKGLESWAKRAWVDIPGLGDQA